MEIEWSIKELIKPMILEILKKYVLLVMKQANLLSYISDFMKTKSQDLEKRKLRADVLNSVSSLAQRR